MKQIIKIFNSEKIRVFLKNNEPYFSISDICNILNMSNVTDTLKTLSKDDIDSIDVIDKLNRKQSIYIINEYALYDVIFKSKKPEAKAFKKWVTHEVLPSIRKTGKYSIPENVKQFSTEKRNELTNEWKNHGIEKPFQYAQLTLEEYKLLDMKGKLKKDMSKGELLLLSALESLEALKLFNDNTIEGYYPCKDSLNKTSNNLKEIIDKNKEITKQM